MPLEVALAKYDEVAHLLVALGAEVNLPTRESLRYGGDNRDNHYTYLDYAQAMISKLEEAKNPKSTTQSTTTSAFGTGRHRLTRRQRAIASADRGDAAAPADETDNEQPAWKVELLKIHQQVEQLEREKSKTTSQIHQPQAFIDEIKNYYNDVAELLSSHQGKSGAEIFKSKLANEQRLQTLKSRLNTYHHSTYTPIYGLNHPLRFYRHGYFENSSMRAKLSERYEELYAACWSGNNAKIQRLCLPQVSQKETPLQISVHWGDNWRGELNRLIASITLLMERKGYTPLFVAMLARRWNTAKLIIAIATAQYSPDQPKVQQQKFSTLDLALG